MDKRTWLQLIFLGIVDVIFLFLVSILFLAMKPEEMILPFFFFLVMIITTISVVRKAQQGKI